MSRRVAISLLVLALLLAAAVVARLAVGGNLADLPAADRAQVLGLRQQKVVSGIVVGICLAVGGVMLQSLLRNPLASPDILGLSTGAGFAVMLSMYLTWSFVSRDRSGGDTAAYSVAGWHAGPALTGSLGALAIVYILSQRRGLVDPPSLVLIGIIVGIMCGAATMLLQHLMPDRGVGSARLLMGTLSDDTTWGQLAATGAVAAAGLAIGIWAGPAMDAAAMGDDEARSVGVPLGALRAGLFVVSGAMTAAAVVIAGPIGFVGLVCPHLVRLMVGVASKSARRGLRWHGHRVLVIGSALAGGALIVGADALVKSLNLASGRMPIGVLTALLGGPAFVVLLRRQSHSGT